LSRRERVSLICKHHNSPHTSTRSTGICTAQQQETHTGRAAPAGILHLSLARRPPPLYMYAAALLALWLCPHLQADMNHENVPLWLELFECAAVVRGLCRSKRLLEAPSAAMLARIRPRASVDYSSFDVTSGILFRAPGGSFSNSDAGIRSRKAFAAHVVS
jgi:hypothetical protein